MPDKADPHRQLTMSSPAAYLIRVRGWVDASWPDYFDNFSIVVSAPLGMPPETTLCGRVPDQSALLGIVHRLNEMKVSLISIECLAE